MTENMSLVVSIIGLVILWTVTVVGFANWFQSKLNGMKNEILTDFNAKHHQNDLTMKAMEKLVMRHDLLLDPEFLDNAHRVRANHGGLRQHG